mgnify:CR=1 FL=1
MIKSTQPDTKAVKKNPSKGPDQKDNHDYGYSGTSTLNKPTKAVSPYQTEEKKGPKTRIIIKYDVGFSNEIFLRGKGANLSWDKGIPLKNIKNDEWLWETDVPFTHCEFKVLINDHHYEVGENHKLSCGAHIHYTPKF